MKRALLALMLLLTLVGVACKGDSGGDNTPENPRPAPTYLVPNGPVDLSFEGEWNDEGRTKPVTFYVHVPGRDDSIVHQVKSPFIRHWIGYTGDFAEVSITQDNEGGRVTGQFFVGNDTAGTPCHIDRPFDLDKCSWRRHPGGA